MRQPDQPLVYVNAAFEELAGFPQAEVLGRNCRFLQSPDTDPAAVARIRAAIDRGEECRETVLNLRGPDRTPWWNEIHLSPVVDDAGTVVRYIGVQHDVTARVEAERALLQERDRNEQYLARIQELAYTDPLTGLPNRRRLEEQVETAIWSARAGADTLALLFVDLERLQGGQRRARPRRRRRAAAGGRPHAARPAAPQRPAGPARRGRVPRGADRPGPGHGRGPRPRRVADELTAAVRAPVPLRGQEVAVGASIGVAVYPADGEEFEALLHAADLGMYAHKAGDGTALSRRRRRALDRERRPAGAGQPRSGGSRLARPPSARAVSCSTSSAAGTLRCRRPPVRGQLHHADDAVGPGRARPVGRPASASRAAMTAASASAISCSVAATRSARPDRPAWA